MKQMYILGILIAITLVALFAFARLPQFFSKSAVAPAPQTPSTSMDETTAQKGTTTAIIHTSKGPITLELFVDQMPITTANFIKLAREGFYEGVKFHRVMDGFMIQAGDPKTKNDALMSEWGTGGPGYTIEDEFVAGLSNVRGTIAMANTGAPNSGGSQFFINLVDNVGLDFDKPPMQSSHPVFGRVTEGFAVVEEIGKVRTGPQNRPVEPIVIERIEIVE